VARVQWASIIGAACAVLAAVACGGTVDKTGTTSVGPEEPFVTGGRSGSGGAFSGGAPQGSGGSGTGSVPVLPDARYDDPGCKPSQKVEGPRECNTVTQSGCSSGERCVPYVDYGEKCEAEEVGTRCDLAGEATQGDDCTFEICASGFVCVTGGAGFVCARLCSMSASADECPPGLLCSPLDVDGFAVCS
jgi:hypothetical protein